MLSCSTDHADESTIRLNRLGWMLDLALLVTQSIRLDSCRPGFRRGALMTPSAEKRTRKQHKRCSRPKQQRKRTHDLVDPSSQGCSTARAIEETSRSDQLCISQTMTEFIHQSLILLIDFPFQFLPSPVTSLKATPEPQVCTHGTQAKLIPTYRL